jgi:hypothetical protein
MLYALLDVENVMLEFWYSCKAFCYSSLKVKKSENGPVI